MGARFAYRGRRRQPPVRRQFAATPDDSLPVPSPSSPWGYTVAVAAIFAITVLGMGWAPNDGPAVMPMAYLLGVLIVASRTSMGPALLASVLGFLAFNFFFLEPRFTFRVANPEDLLALSAFLVAATVVSRLTTRLRAEIEAAADSSRRIVNLYDFNRKISVAATREEVHAVIVRHFATTVRCTAQLWLPVADGLAAAASFPLWVRLNKTTIDAAAAAWKAAGTTNMEGQLAKSWTFLPLSTAGQAVGLLGLGMPDGRAFDRPLDETLVATLLRQAAGAIERTNLLSEIEATRLAAQREELRSALLSSLSHDLRTPLVSILVAATSLSEFENEIDAKNRRDILKTIEDEAERLNRYVENLLNMTRISANSLKPNADWADLQDIIGAAINRIRPVSRAHVIGVALGEAPILLHVDSILLEQVFVNLLDNACKYAPPQSVITIAARMSDDTVAISVGDHGPGITADQRDRIFETFYRVNRAETSGRPGTGLGLAICRGIVLAHGGTIRAEAPPYGSGLVVVVELPRRYAALPEDRDRPSADGQD